jgi:hypothetical protein
MVRPLHNCLFFCSLLISSLSFATRKIYSGASTKMNIHLSSNFDSLTSFYSFTDIDGGKLVSKLYPNPASSYVIIDFEKNLPPNTHLIVYSFTGNKMEDVTISNLRVQLNLGNYFRGLYLYQIVASTGKILESGKFQVIK